LSCDHTVGRTYEEFMSDKDVDVHAAVGRFHHIYKLEMEREPLSAGTRAQQQNVGLPEEAPKEEAPKSETPKSETPKSELRASSEKGGKPGPGLPPRPGDPGP